MKKETIIIVTIFIVCFLSFGILVYAKIDSLEKSVNGVINNKYFSDVVGSMSESIVMVRIPVSPEYNPSSVDAIYVDNEGKPWKFGTGFVIKSDSKTSYILTAYHVVDNSSDIEIVLNDEKTTFNATLYKLYTDKDLAIINVANKFKEVKIGKVENIRVGTKVAFTGYPLYGPAQVTHDGIISFIGLHNGIPTITIHSFVNSGNSGGPVFLADSGEVIGVINARELGINRVPPLIINIPEQFSPEAKAIIQLQQQIYNLLSVKIVENTQMGIGIATPIDQSILSDIK
jgi:S1-C subfamily serine protease